MGDTLLVLMVEDSAADADLVVRELQGCGFAVGYERVETAAAMRAALEVQPWDLVLCDDGSPELDASAALALYQERRLDIPFIIVSGAIGEERVTQLLKSGAHDCVLKNNLSRLAPAVTEALRAVRERRIQQGANLKSSYLASLVESCNDAIIGATLEGMVVSWNGGAERLYGYPAREMIGRPLSLLFPSNRPDELPEILQRLKNGATVLPFETLRLRKDGTTIEVAVTLSPIKDPGGRVIGASSITRDISHFKRDEKDRLTLIRDLTDALSRIPQQA